MKGTFVLFSILFTDGEMVAAESQVIPPGTSWSLPRANVAKFVLQLLKTDEWNKKLIAVSIKT